MEQSRKEVKIGGPECVKEMVNRLYPQVGLTDIELVTSEVFKYINEKIEEHKEEISETFMQELKKAMEERSQKAEMIAKGLKEGKVLLEI